jgi:zinc protease
VFFIRTKSRFLQKTVGVFFLAVILAGLLKTGVSSAAVSDSICFAAKWPSELSELAPDPSLLRGRLANGFRYVIKQNQEPQERVGIFLAVQAGSLNESEEQRGLAHFLEHMLFNGSTNFPPGSLISYFQSLGMAFGADTNARTSHDQTVYNIFLPNGSEKDLNSGFQVMADYARGALLLDTEIDRERGVIFAEKRGRDSAGYRTQVAKSDFVFRGTRYPERMPIGIEKTLTEADHDRLKAYYDAWYRPENMILVVVGDSNPQLIKELIEKHFARLTAAGPQPECPDFGQLSHQGIETFYHYEPELGQTTVAIETYWDLPVENDSLLLEKKELLRIIGSMIMGYRLQKILEDDEVPFAQANYYSGDIVNRLGYAAVSGQVAAEHWQESLSYFDRILRRAILYGFSESEVERAKKEIVAQLDARVLTAASEDSRTIARRIINHLNSNRVYQSAEQEKNLYEPMTREVTPAEVNRIFQESWSHNSRLVSVTGDARLGEDGNAAIASVYKSSSAQPVAASTSESSHIFPYIDPFITKNSPQKSSMQDIEVERLVFSNGLVVNLKRTLFEENRIRIRADFGAGKLDEQKPGTALLVEGIINGSGSGKLPRSAVDELLAGTSINMSFDIDEATFSWTGTALAGDFELYCQLLQHLLLDPGFRENVFTTVKEKYALMYQNINQAIEGALPLQVQPFLAEDNQQFGLPSWEELARLNFADLKQWVHSFVKPVNLEISVVGDFDRSDVTAVLTKYFSGIESVPAQLPSPSAVQFPTGKKLDIKIGTSVDKSMIVIAWPTEDSWNIHRTRRLHLLADVFGDRLREVIREKMAASYSPKVSSFSSRTYYGYGYIIAQMLVEPGTEDEVIEEVLKLSDQLQSKGIRSGELERARGPLLTSLKGSVKTNKYWLNTVLSLSGRYPQQLEWPTTLISDYSSISGAEINQLAARYLNNKKAALVKVMPDKAKRSRNAARIDNRESGKSS